MKDDIRDERAQSAGSGAEPELPPVNWQFPDTDQWSITIRKGSEGSRLKKSRQAERDHSKLIICLRPQQPLAFLVFKSQQITSIRAGG